MPICENTRITDTVSQTTIIVFCDITLFTGESSTTCHLRLWYWMSGAEAGSFHIQLMSGSNEVTEVWMTDGNHGNLWHKVRAVIHTSTYILYNMRHQEDKGQTYKCNVLRYCTAFNN